MKIKTALISVSDKRKLKPLLNILKKNKVKIISSGGTFKEIKKLAFRLDNKILKKVILFDVYKGKDLPKNKKSYGISFFFNSKNKTLTDIQIDKIMDKFKKEFYLNLNAELR